MEFAGRGKTRRNQEKPGKLRKTQENSGNGSSFRRHQEHMSEKQDIETLVLREKLELMKMVCC